MVAQLAGLKVSWEELRKLVVNPRTNRPIAKTSFSRIFAQELEQARGKLKELIASGFYNALANGEAWALRLALKNVFHYSLENNSLLPVMDVEEQQQKRIEVVFCTPDPKPLPAPVLDVTPAQRSRNRRHIGRNQHCRRRRRQARATVGWIDQSARRGAAGAR
jgi:hypothetical protein